MDIEKSEKEFGLLVYASSFAGYLIPLGSILGPLILWLMKREESRFVDQCGRNCLNFKISLFIYVVVSAVLVLVGIGVILLAALAILDLVCTVIGTVKASEGKVYKYPLTIKFLDVD